MGEPSRWESFISAIKYRLARMAIRHLGLVELYFADHEAWNKFFAESLGWKETD